MSVAPGGSVGRVATSVVDIALPAEGLRLDSGATLPALQVAYETYGRRSPEGDNVVFICHALTGDAHVAGYHDESNPATVGWWDEMIGPGKGIDTDHYQVICANILGGCKGTTGPGSIDPRTGHPYGSTFPAISVGDIVTVHRLLLRQLGIERLAAVVGGSFGGMQVLEWAIRFPETIDHAVCIASAAGLTAQALAFDVVGRGAITYDPEWRGGDYYASGRGPSGGLSLARKIGHITYLSQTMMSRKFGRERRSAGGSAGETRRLRPFQSDFEIESYLDHQGAKFVDRFDANSYLHITRAMDEFDLAGRHESLEQALAGVRAKMLIVALSSDWLFPKEQSMEIAHALLRAGKAVSYCLLHAPHGHDAFLVDIEHLSEVIRSFLPWVRSHLVGQSVLGVGETKPRRRQRSVGMIPPARNAAGEALVREENRRLLDMVPPGARVLDLGCGSGRLLTLLAEERRARGMGVDIDIHNVIDVIDRGHDVFQTDVDEGLAMIPDGAYDVAILSETLQVVRQPRFVLREMLRVARVGVLSFPNFGHWSHRLNLGLTGRMPLGGALPYAWYETPNIHLFTLHDFKDLCRDDGISIIDMICVPRSAFSRLLVGLRWCNLGADRVVVKIARSTSGDSMTACGCRPGRSRPTAEGGEGEDGHGYRR